MLDEKLLWKNEHLNKSTCQVLYYQLTFQMNIDYKIGLNARINKS